MPPYSEPEQKLLGLINSARRKIYADGLQNTGPIFHELASTIREVNDRHESIHPFIQTELEELLNEINHEDIVIYDVDDFRTFQNQINHFVTLGDFGGGGEVSSKIPELEFEDGDDVVFLLGAGASAASNIPTVGNLLPKLLDRARQIGRDDLDDLVRFCRNHDMDNIENLLTAAYISDFAATDQNIADLVHYFLFSQGSEPPNESPRPDVTSVKFTQETLQTLFGLLTSTMISKNPNPTHESIREFATAYENISIVTTNYDCCIDEELVESGIGLTGTIGEENPKGHEETVELLKMHGSINWEYCESCQNVGKSHFPELKQNYMGDRQSYSVVGICPNCYARRRPLLVPPISFKFLMFPDLIDIWYQARDRIAHADYIIVVGYSFADADAYLSKIISQAMDEDSDKQLVLINPNSEVTQDLRNRYERDITDFDADSRITGIHGNAEEVIPELIDNLMESVEESQQVALDESGQEPGSEGEEAETAQD